MSQTNLQMVTFAFQKAGIVDETQSPTAVQAANGLQIMNDYLADQAADGMRLGWFPQTNLAATAPLKDADIHGVKLLMTAQFALSYGVKIEDPVLIASIEGAERRLVKRSLRYFESDLSELSRPQGGPWGGPNWF